jgi:flagellar basal body rod protein FlgC
VNLITANRAYEANLKVMQAFRQQAEQALLLVRA